MRQPPTRIMPQCLPDIERAAARIQREAVDRPDRRLADASIGQLVLSLTTKPAYLTGSNAWLRAIYDAECPAGLDYDVVLSSEAEAQRFIQGCIESLNRRMPESHRFSTSTTMFGSARIVDPSGVPIIDAWHLDAGESIAELIMGYPHEHQRAAYLIGVNPGPSGLVRLARRAERRMAVGKMRSSGYPGSY